MERNKYSLRNCNPTERKKRMEINKMDFKMEFPFYKSNKDLVDLSLLRRFLYQNKISAYMLYTESQIEQQLKDKKKLPTKMKQLLLSDDIEIKTRFELLDL